MCSSIQVKTSVATESGSDSMSPSSLRKMQWTCSPLRSDHTRMEFGLLGVVVAINDDSLPI
ncbi:MULTISPECIES: hypothetical protein [Leptolyngbya]|uniref:hypothetical protein n=1 Tax=Leptolyngbya TaxID=47251 RepID=UPI0011819516|nr:MULTISPECIES: hypothetical protein [Leptolyngbya]MBD2369472.1 hypothetical protein [Leptolyngbya sp. FACHB-161]MBD2376783.1 hypothetical protein [Leptolyngbya sp. FACHB-238]MBD2401150.1 hypothetical protein [Leptolyngbya sp. FACHB-239]MBD2407701.1 hypothetical protein [Leptolyngbya sp. FACHB-402]ULP27837.1 hypothetical protein MCP04_17570 [Leptolyngbya boryana IU 594]